MTTRKKAGKKEELFLEEKKKIASGMWNIVTIIWIIITVLLFIGVVSYPSYASEDRRDYGHYGTSPASGYFYGARSIADLNDAFHGLEHDDYAMDSDVGTSVYVSYKGPSACKELNEFLDFMKGKVEERIAATGDADTYASAYKDIEEARCK